MYTIDKFFCTNLSNGAIAYGWFSIIYSVITAFVSLLKVEIGTLFWYTFLGVGTGILLIIAVKKNSRFLLLPWLGLNAFQIVIATPIAIVILFWRHMSEPGLLFGALIYIVLLTLVIGYGWIGVYSLYRLFENENKNGISASPRGQV